MRNGVERRNNGSVIFRFNSMYWVIKMDGDGKMVDSKHGPWDYLASARADSKGYYDDLSSKEKKAEQ